MSARLIYSAIMRRSQVRALLEPPKVSFMPYQIELRTGEVEKPWLIETERVFGVIGRTTD